MRSFCVIPHGARESAFFDAVFEDGVRVRSDGRLLPLPFTHVLSPAHDPVKLVNGPLLESVREGGNALLVVALPARGGDDGDGVGGRAAPWSRRRGPRSSAMGTDAESGLHDGTDLATELYANLLPLLFHSAEQCTHASVSVVTTSAQDRSLVDELGATTASASASSSDQQQPQQPQQRLVRSLQEVSWMAVPREGSASLWGPVFHALAARHTSLAEEPGSLAGETACVVTVQLGDGYGRVVVVDAGSDQALLHALTLVLGAADRASTPPRPQQPGSGRGSSSKSRDESFARPRTYPPRTPLLTLLKKNIALDDGVVHVVAIPAPQCEARNSLRILRFASDCAFYDAGEPAAERAATPALSGRGDGGAPRPSSKAPASTTRLQFLNDSDNPSQQQQRSGAAKPTPSPLPPYRPPPQAAVQDPSSATREQHLVARVADLEAQVLELTASRDAVQTARRHVEKQVGTLNTALREKQDAWLAMEERNRALQAEKEHFSALVPKLLRKVAQLEKRRDELAATQSASERATRNSASALQERDSTIAALQEQLARLKKTEAQRLRLSNLQRMAEANNSQEMSRLSRASSASRPTTAATRRGNSSSERGRADRVAAIALEELRRRNTECQRALERAEGEVGRLRARVAAAEEQAARAERGFCPSCEALEERLAYFMRELAHLRKEKDELVRAVVGKGGGDTAASVAAPTRGRRDGGDESACCVVQRIVHALEAGCASIHAQLEAVQGAPLAARRGASVDPKVAAEHMRAVRALEDSVREVGSRTYTLSGLAAKGSDPMSGAGAGCQASLWNVPPTATAADVAALTSMLSFEAERVVHLRAFLPTFAQLGVATEHLRMQLARATARRK